MPAKFHEPSAIPAHIVADGVAIRPLTGENVQVVLSEIEAGLEFPLHTHPHEQFIVVLEGGIEFEIDGERRELGPGGVFYFESNTPHGARVGDQGVRLVEVFSPPRADYRDAAAGFDHDKPR